jgi:hypothetical protein
MVVKASVPHKLNELVALAQHSMFDHSLQKLEESLFSVVDKDRVVPYDFILE